MNSERSPGVEGGARTVPKLEALDLESSSKLDCTKRAEVHAFIVVYCLFHMH